MSPLLRLSAARPALALLGLAAAALCAAAPAAAAPLTGETGEIVGWLERQTGGQIDPHQLRLGFVDLDGDGRQEAVALYTNVIHCDGSGCDGWILRRDGSGGGLVQIGEFSSFELPTVSMAESGSAWPDLIVHDALSGRDRVLRFDGRAYR